MSASQKGSIVIALALGLTSPVSAQISCPPGYGPVNTLDGWICYKAMEADFRNHIRDALADITWELEDNADCEHIKDYAETIYEWKLRNGIQVYEFSSTTVREGFHELYHNPNYHWMMNRTKLRARNRWGLVQLVTVHEITHHLFGRSEVRAQNAAEDCVIR